VHRFDGPAFFHLLTPPRCCHCHLLAPTATVRLRWNSHPASTGGDIHSGQPTNAHISGGTGLCCTPRFRQAASPRRAVLALPPRFQLVVTPAPPPPQRHAARPDTGAEDRFRHRPRRTSAQASPRATPHGRFGRFAAKDGNRVATVLSGGCSRLAVRHARVHLQIKGTPVA
jgi:hypothetical protein